MATPTSDPAITNILTDLLSHLIRMPTITADHATNRAALDWVEEQLRDLPLTIRHYEHGGFPSLVAVSSGARNPKAPKLWLVGHMDVVPAPAKAFEPRIANGRIHGRGVHDMKFAIACFIALFQELGPKLADSDLGLMITTDEEYGGYNGTKWLIEDQGYHGQTVITPDSGGSWEMELGSKGILWWEVTATGRTAHASRTWEGDNAIAKLLKFIEHIQSNVPTEPCRDPNHAHATVNFGSIHAGTDATNQVPDSATGRLDIRIPPEITIAEVGEWFTAAQAAVPGVAYTSLVADPPYRVKQNGEITAFRRIIKDVTGHDVTPTTAHGSSDARHFAHHNISTINVCPTGSGFHVADEWVDLADLDRFYEVVRRFVTEWSRQP